MDQYSYYSSPGSSTSGCYDQDFSSGANSMGLPSPSGDMDPRFLALSDQHMFRHNSEIEKQLKGGYLNGSISIPNAHSYVIELSLRPVTDYVNGKEMKFHPCLLFVANHMKRKGQRGRKRGKKRKRTMNNVEDLDDVENEYTSSDENDGSEGSSTNNNQSNKVKVSDVQWRVRMRKSGNRLSLQGLDGQWLALDGAMVTDGVTGETRLRLGKEDGQLEVTIIRPLCQRGKEGNGVHIRKVLENIFANSTDPSLQHWTVDTACNAFAKDKTASLNEVRMHVKILSDSHQPLGQDTSGVISNSKDEANNQLGVLETFFSIGSCHRHPDQDFFADIVLEKKIKDKVNVELVPVRASVQGGKKVVEQVQMPQVRINQEGLSVQRYHNLFLHVSLPAQEDLSNLTSNGCSVGIKLSRENKQRKETEKCLVPIPYAPPPEGGCAKCNKMSYRPLSPQMEEANLQVMNVGGFDGNFQHNQPIPVVLANNCVQPLPQQQQQQQLEAQNAPLPEALIEGVDFDQFLDSLKSDPALHELMNNPNVQIDGATGPASPGTSASQSGQRVLVKSRNGNKSNKNDKISDEGGNLTSVFVKIFLSVAVLALAYLYK